MDFVSPSLEDVLGVPPDAPLEEWFASIHPDDAARALSANERSAREGVAFDEIFRLFHGAKQEWRWIHAVSHRETGTAPDGCVHHSGMCIDVTDQMRAQNERDALARERARLHRMESLGVLAARIAHDFNNQLAAIQACATVALHPQSVGTERPAAMLREIVAIVGSANRGTRDLLAYARSDPGKAAALYMNEVLADAVRVAEHARPDTPFEMEGEAEVAVRGDRGALERLLTNLLINAADASVAGSPVQVRLSATPAHTVVEVEDHGEGMDAATLDRVFEPFFSTKAGSGSGSGLGLAGAEEIAHDHGGSLAARSQPEVGTVMTLRIPLPPPQNEDPVSESALAVAHAHLAELDDADR